jgi:hypothetical protein
MAPIDVDRLRLRSSLNRVRSARPPRPVKGERFLKGPVPLPWLEAAAKLPGKSFHAAIALWYAAGLTGSATVSLSNLGGHRFGFDRSSKYRALAWLEEAGLIKVERKLGRSPLVTIQDVPRSSTDDGHP